MFGDAIDLNRELVNKDRLDKLEKNVEEYVQALNVTYSELIAKAKEHQKEEVEKYLEKSPENPATFEIGDLVLMSYPSKGPKKLHAKWRGPLSITEANGNTYSLQDLTTKSIIKVDISRLKLYKTDPNRKNVEVAARDQDEYHVEEIIDHRGSPKRKAQMMFRVRWTGFEPDEDTWEPWKLVKDLEVLDAYGKMHPELHL